METSECFSQPMAKLEEKKHDLRFDSNSLIGRAVAGRGGLVPAITTPRTTTPSLLWLKDMRVRKPLSPLKMDVSSLEMINRYSERAEYLSASLFTSLDTQQRKCEDIFGWKYKLVVKAACSKSTKTAWRL